MRPRPSDVHRLVRKFDRRLGAIGAPLLALFAGCRHRTDDGPAPTPSAPSFETRREHAIPAKPTALLAADLDGDGRPELLATDAERGEIRVWRGDSAGLSEPDRVVPVGGWPLGPLALPAARGAVRSVAIASRARRDVQAFDLLGKVPEHPLWRVVLPATPRAIAIGDLGHDGAFDLAVACDDGRLALVGPEGRARELPIADGLPRCALVLADGSGVVLGYQDRRSLLLIDPQAAGTRAEIHLGGIPRDLLEADVDGDGDPELVVAGGDGSIWVLGFGEAGGSKAWSREGAPAPIAWPAGAIPIDIDATDLDGDGRVELVWLAYHDLAWNVAGGFARSGPAWRRSAYAGQTPCALALLDRDGDGHVDLIAANRDSQSLSFARGLGADGFACPRRVQVGRFPTALVAGDLDRDGLPDIVVIESKDDTAAVLSNRSGELARSAILPTGPDPRAPCLADLDLDGRLDLALVADDPEGSRVRLWFGDGAGGLGERSGIEGPRVGKGVRALLAVDLDRDGRVDLLAADCERSAIEWWRNRPSVTRSIDFEDPRTIEVGDGPCALAPIELDADPAPEIAVALGGPGPRTGVALLDFTGLAEPTFRELGRLETGGAPCALATAELDGDGLADLAVLVLQSNGSSQGEARCYLREKAAFAPAFRLAGSFATSAHPRAIVPADLDGDGLADLVVPAQYAHRVDLATPRRANGGKPWRLEVQDALGAGVGCMDAVVVDLNGDGKLDIAVVNGHSDDVTVLYATRR